MGAAGEELQLDSDPPGRRRRSEQTQRRQIASRRVSRPRRQATAEVELRINQLQALDLETMDDGALAQARSAFEPRWNRWNRIRTVVATLTSALLMVLVLRL